MYGIEDWSVNGKVSYRLPDNAGSANLRWTQQAGQSRLRLAGPLGAGSTEISSEGALLRIRQDGIQRLYQADAAPWLPGAAPLPVPVTSIRYWLRGVPDPQLGLDDLTFRDGLAERLAQGAWLVEYDSYQSVKGLELPQRMTLLYPDEELRITLILREWSLP